MPKVPPESDLLVTLGEEFTVELPLPKKSEEDLRAQIEKIRNGIMANEVLQLMKSINVSQHMFLNVLHLSARTLERRKSGHQRLKPEESERVLRLETVFGLAVEVLGNLDAAQRWFQKPRAELGGDTPFAHCDTEPGRIEVERVLNRIADGVYA